MGIIVLSSCKTDTYVPCAVDCKQFILKLKNSLFFFKSFNFPFRGSLHIHIFSHSFAQIENNTDAKLALDDKNIVYNQGQKHDDSKY